MTGIIKSDDFNQYPIATRLKYKQAVAESGHWPFFAEEG